MADSIKLSPVKGTRDFYPEELRLRNWLFDQWRTVSLQFGYEEYDSCVLEHEALYIRKAGDEITGQLYNFEDKGKRRVALRPEMTPTLARMVMAKVGTLPLPARWFSIPQCFRYEETQRGRKREHYQWNMDVIGLSHVAAEAELMAAQVEFLTRAGLELRGESPDVILRTSNRQVLQDLLQDYGVTSEQFEQVCIIIDKRDKIGREATHASLEKIGIADATAGKVLDLLEVKGLEDLKRLVPESNSGVSQLQTLIELAQSSGFADAVRIDLSVVRGLSYYTGTVWEVFDHSGALPRAIAGGGRYDRLMETLGGKPMPMVGFGFGDVVIAEILADRGRLPELGRSVDDVVYPMTEGTFAAANRVAASLRKQQRSVVVDYSCRRFKHVIKRAEELDAKRLLIIGDSELERGVCKVRTLDAAKTESDVPLDSFS